MNRVNLKSDLLLLSTAIIWGFAFVAQRLGMEVIGPFLFNGIRFVLGAVFILAIGKLLPGKSTSPRFSKHLLLSGSLTGAVLFAGASLQQVGIIYTTAGKAGFITGLYVVLVPLLGLLQRQKTHWGTWLGVVLVGTGLYFLSVNEDFSIAPGDLLVLFSALFWAIHVQLIGGLAQRFRVVDFAVVQYLTCAALSLLVSAVSEPFELTGIWQGALPLFYAGFFSIGIAYTLQIVGMKHAPPAHAAIILSFESVFAVVGGWLLLQEQLSLRGLLGCALMLLGMLSSQLNLNFSAKKQIAVEFK